MSRICKMFIGVTIACLGIAMTLNSDLGCFIHTACYKAISVRTGIPLYICSIIGEVIMLVIATYYGEGLGWATITNATYGSIVINIFHSILPHSKLMVLGILLIPIGWSTLEKAELGSTGSNILMKALMCTTGKSLLFIRTIIEGSFLLITYIACSRYASVFTIFLTFATPAILALSYSFMGHKPAEINHKYIIKLGSR